MMRSLVLLASLTMAAFADQKSHKPRMRGAEPALAQEHVAPIEEGAFFQWDMYTITAIPLGIMCLAMAWMTRPKTDEHMPPQFSSFKWTYLAVWYIAVAADWLQGPYVYALYSAYGYPGAEIGQLFVAGFGASMVFGTFVGSLADSWGRKRCCVLYCILYILSCLTKHSNNFHILMVGRVTGGIATSILFSCFESWMVSEHLSRHGFSGGLLRYMFTMMFFGMYVAAIIAGIVAQFVVDMFPMKEIWAGSGIHWGGYTGPFDLSILCLLICLFPMMAFWNENHGSGAAGGASELMSSLSRATGSLFSNWRIGVMCLVVSAFEGSMFAFVFNWTPALESKTLPPPHGLIFAEFMMACMIGASASSLIGGNLKPAVVLVPTIMLGTLALGLVAMAAGFGSTMSLQMCFFCFLLFEFCVGVYFPTIGTLKSEIVPESIRATIYNLYRVPLNAVVCMLLLNNFTMTQVFSLCTCLLLLASSSMIPILTAGTVASGPKAK